MASQTLYRFVPAPLLPPATNWHPTLCTCLFARLVRPDGITCAPAAPERPWSPPRRCIRNGSNQGPLQVRRALCPPKLAHGVCLPLPRPACRGARLLPDQPADAPPPPRPLPPPRPQATQPVTDLRLTEAAGTGEGGGVTGTATRGAGSLARPLGVAVALPLPESCALTAAVAVLLARDDERRVFQI